MFRSLTTIFLVFAFLGMTRASPAFAASDGACRPSGNPTGGTGVVLLHGKQGLSPNVNEPGGFGDDWLRPVRQKLEEAGFIAFAPELPWSASREYDRSYQQALDEIGGAVKGLKERGAKRVVVLGFSMGGNAALGYAALRGGVTAVIIVSPGHTPEIPEYQKLVAPSVAKARSMIAAGQGSQITTFKDASPWKEKDGALLTSAASFLSYFDPNGDEVMPRNAAKLKPGTPLLWIVGAADQEAMGLGRGYAFDKAPPNPLNRYVVVPRGHLEAPSESAPLIVNWLRCL